jgi:hypothetical protein
MSDKPILFSGPMVRALLEDRKTQTRRILTHAPAKWDFMPEGMISRLDGKGACFRWRAKLHKGDEIHDCNIPIAPGDRLWVKEAHYAYGFWRTTKEITKKTGKFKREFVRYPVNPVIFDAPPDLLSGRLEKKPGFYKRSSLFMPKADSRLFLEVLNVRVQRLLDIDEVDAKAEGPSQHPMYPSEYYVSWREAFKHLWDSINEPSAPWSDNPWVVAYRFKVVSSNISTA